MNSLPNPQPRPPDELERLKTFVKDRPGHDRRYAIDATKINKELGWQPSVTFEEGLSQTIDWYLQNEDWLKHVTSGAYQDYYNTQYSRSLYPVFFQSPAQIHWHHSVIQTFLYQAMLCPGREWPHAIDFCAGILY